MAKWFKNEYVRKKNRDRAERNWIMGMEWMKNKPPPVSIEDRTVVGTIDQGLNCTNHVPEVGDSRNR